MIILSSVICLFGCYRPISACWFWKTVVRLRHCDVQTAINEAMAGLKHNVAAQ
jgi:hypothetical protein